MSSDRLPDIHQPRNPEDSKIIEPYGTDRPQNQMSERVDTESKGNSALLQGEGVTSSAFKPAEKDGVIIHNKNFKVIEDA